ncbi:Diacylglycerol kinase [compost metagenome]
MSYTAIAIIYNPKSTGSSERLARELEARLRADLPGQEIELIATGYKGHGRELAYSIAMASKNPLIISSSGDGGYHEVINGAMRAQSEGAHPTTGLLPAGNANDHHRNLHDEDIVSTIKRQKSIKIDLLKMSGTSKGEKVELYAHSYIGLGLTPFVGRELNKTKLNAAAEIWAVVHALLTVQSIKLRINGRVARYESVIFSNVDTMSKYLSVSQPSSITDGKFEVTIFERRSKMQLIMTLLKASTQGVQEDHTVHEFSLETVNKTLVQADGEIIVLDANSNVSIKAERQTLNCIV